MTFDAIKTFAMNDPGSTLWSEDSFIGVLHERQRWDENEYFRVEAALYERIKSRRTIDRSRDYVDRVAARIFGFGMLMFSCHFDPSDGFQIRNLELEELRQWRERFQLVFESFYGNKMPGHESLVPANPFLATASD